MKRFVFAVLAAFLFASPALAHGGGGGAFIFVFVGGGGPMRVPESTVGDYTNIHKIGILSAIGNNFDVSWNSGDPVRHDISVWKIDDLVRTTLVKYLSSKYELSDLPFDGQAIAAINKHWFRERDTLNLLGTFTNPGVDAYLIVRPADGTLPGPAGLGIDLTNSEKVLLWTNFEIDIIDAHKLTYIGKAYAQLQVQEGMPPAFAVRQPPISTDRI